VVFFARFRSSSSGFGPYPIRRIEAPFSRWTPLSVDTRLSSPNVGTPNHRFYVEIK
jgi:hypothetical protein